MYPFADTYLCRPLCQVTTTTMCTKQHIHSTDSIIGHTSIEQNPQPGMEFMCAPANASKLAAHASQIAQASQHAAEKKRAPTSCEGRNGNHGQASVVELLGLHVLPCHRVVLGGQTQRVKAKVTHLVLRVICNIANPSTKNIIFRSLSFGPSQATVSGSCADRCTDVG